MSRLGGALGALGWLICLGLGVVVSRLLPLVWAIPLGAVAALLVALGVTWVQDHLRVDEQTRARR